MIHRFRRCAAVLMAAGCVCSVAACGSSSSSKSSSSSRPSFAGGHGGFAQLTSSERSCLSKHGLKLSAGGAGAHRPGNFKGKPGHFKPGSFKGKPGQYKGKRPSFGKGGTRANGASGFRGGTFTKAFKACGIKEPSFHGRPGGAGGTQTSSAS